MALTMTRTRTQTALAKLVELLARVNGELAFVRELLVEALGHVEGLQAREKVLVTERAALVRTLHQFDPSLDPEAVGCAEDWWPGRRPRTRAEMARRYLEELNSSPQFASSPNLRQSPDSR